MKIGEIIEKNGQSFKVVQATANYYTAVPCEVPQKAEVEEEKPTKKLKKISTDLKKKG